jgi:hypothetical protein
MPLRRPIVVSSVSALVFFILLASCGTSHDEMARASNRAQLNKLTVDCASTRANGCLELGDDLAHKSKESQLSDWTEPEDRPLAKKVYDVCCGTGNGLCCRAIVEQRLASSPAENEQYKTLATAYGAPMRSREELADEENKMQASIEAREQSLTAERAEEAAKADRDRQAILGLTQQVAQSVDHASAELATRPRPAPVVTVAPVQKPPTAEGKPTTRPIVIDTPAPPPPACAPLHASCNSTTQCCGGTMLGNRGNYCTNGACCVMELGPCNVTEDCCNAGLSVGDVCGAAKVCCRPTGVLSNSDGSVCCNGGNPRVGCR